MEGLTTNYDSTVRDVDGSLIQIYYGEDGLDVLKSRFLNDEHFDFLVENRKAIADDSLLKHLKMNANLEKIGKLRRKIHKWEKKNGSSLTKVRQNEFSKFSQQNGNPNSSKNKVIDPNYGRSKASLSLMKKWVRADDETKNLYRAQCIKCPEPLTAQYRPDLEFGVLPESMEALVDKYVKIESMSFTTGIGKEELRDLLCAKFMSALSQPGEPVGLLGNIFILFKAKNENLLNNLLKKYDFFSGTIYW